MSQQEIKRQIQDSIQAKQYLLQETGKLEIIAGQLVKAFKNGNKVILFGNGGSASDAQHIAAELSGRFYLDRETLPALVLNTSLTALTAIANDYGYEEIFARPLRGLVKKGDIVIGISTSGNSKNVLNGISEAKRRGAVTVAFTGEGGKLKDIADYVLSIPSKDTPRIQEAHILAGHIICYIVEKSIFTEQSA